LQNFICKIQSKPALTTPVPRSCTCANSRKDDLSLQDWYLLVCTS